MRAPQVEKGKRLPREVESQLSVELAAKYDAGASIRQLCAETGYGISRTRRLLLKAGVAFRPKTGGS